MIYLDSTYIFTHARKVCRIGEAVKKHIGGLLPGVG